MAPCWGMQGRGGEGRVKPKVITSNDTVKPGRGREPCILAGRSGPKHNCIAQHKSPKRSVLFSPKDCPAHRDPLCSLWGLDKPFPNLLPFFLAFPGGQLSKGEHEALF